MANQAWQISGPGAMSIKDLGPIQKPGSKEALVRITAVALNYRDKLVVEHSPAYPIKHKPDLIPCCDGAGVVEEPGEGSIWRKGDRVTLHPNTWKKGDDESDFKLDQTLGGGDVDGTLRQWMTVTDDSLFPAPKNLSMDEASTLYTAGVTAYRGLFYGGKVVQKGMRVLTQGTGGVSCYSIMIAAAVGAEVIATSSSDQKLEVARKLGATHLINYHKNPDWASEVLKATDGRGVDIVIDVVGAQSIEQTLKATKYGGLICVVGILSENPGQKVDIMTEILFGAKTLRGQLGAGSKQMAEELVTLMEKYQLHPPVAEVFEFEKADKALEALTKLSGVGKIVVRC